MPVIPMRWHWMIEELKQVKGGGIETPASAIPYSRRLLDRKTLEQLVWLERCIEILSDEDRF